MSTDRNNRSHRPKGLPPRVAGTFEPGTGAGPDSGVRPPEPPDRVELMELERLARTMPAPRPGDIVWRFGTHTIPQQAIDMRYGHDDIRLQRLVILTHADKDTRRMLAARMHDHDWIRSHATPLFKDRACIIIPRPDPWETTEPEPDRPDTRPVWPHPIDTRMIAEDCAAHLDIRRSYTPTRVSRTRNETHVECVDDTTHTPRSYRTGTNIAHLPDGACIEHAADGRWHVVHDDPPLPPHPADRPPAREDTRPHDPRHGTETGTADPPRRSDDADRPRRPASDPRMRQAWIRFLTGLFQGVSSIIRESRRAR
ncbi:hypothetical protein [Bifidobacterium longum]|uniref:hypothetical protein n=1 Tax=Bifidobacterium longum TaxID=216816 RepID=UPI002025B538|nr:hypothetical protein [Bifidobacterium longum]